MKKLLVLSCLAATAVFNCANTNAQTQTQQNTVKGGIAGAILGGIIGHQNDETGEGVAIGAALGALSGNVIGRSQEQAVVRQQQQLAYQQQQQARVVSLDDVVTMTRSGMSDNLIINQIRSGGVQQQVGVSEVIALHQNGVSEPVIRALQAAQVGSVETAPTYVQPVVVRPAPQVIVHPVPVMPTWHYKPRPSPYHPPSRGHHRSSGIQLHFKR